MKSIIDMVETEDNERIADGKTDFMNGAYLGPEFRNDEIKSLKSRRSSTKPSNSDLLSFQNPLEILGVCCIGYLMLIVMTSF